MAGVTGSAYPNGTRRVVSSGSTVPSTLRTPARAVAANGPTLSQVHLERLDPAHGQVLSYPQASPTSTHVETSVTKLLVTTKQLLESLTLWSENRATPEQVSDHFVATGNYFNVAVTAFSKEGISMEELMSVPDDLRYCLEEALSQDPSPSALENYLPRVREIIISLLSGLKAKQATFRARRELVGRSADAPLPALPTAGPSASSSDPRHSARSPPSRRSTPDGTQGMPRPPRRDLPPEPGTTRRPHSPPPPRPPSREGSLVKSRSGSSLDGVLGPQSRVHSGSSRFPSEEMPPVPRISQQIQQSTVPKSSSSSSIRSSASPPPINRPPRVVSPPPPPPPPPPSAPSESGPPDFSSLPYIPTDAFNPFATDSPDRSLEKLSASSALERRASKRYSAYTYSKITSSASKDGLSSAADASAGRELVQNARRPNDLIRAGPRRPSTDTTPSSSRHVTPSRTAALPTMHEDEDEEAASPPRPPFPPPGPTQSDATPDAVPFLNQSIQSSSYPMTVYLQLGRDVKKAVLEEPPSLPTLRIMFTERFQYNPGMSDFPAIYLRDPREQHGVQYEIEDMRDVREGCILSLNIEPLDALKEQINTGLAALQQELKASLATSVSALQQELKELQSSARQISLNALSPHPGSTVGSTPTSPSLTRPSEQQFQAAAQKMLKSSSKQVMGPTSAALARTGSNDPGRTSVDASQHSSPTISQGTGTDGRAARIVSDLKAHYDEVQSVRRDIGALRQVINDFGTHTKATIGNLRSQTASVRHLATTKIGADRAAIRAGKERFEKRMDDLIPQLEELQDTVDDLRTDVTQRGVRPRQQQMGELKTRLDALSREIEDATQQLSTLGPAWKHGWEQELEVIIREQEFLRQQEPLLRDASSDLATLQQVFQTMVQYTTAVGGSSTPGADGSLGRRTPRVAIAAEEPGDHATVMASVRALAPDPQRRLQAIEQAERAREADLANRSDAFRDELGGFVDGKKLRKTGGPEEADRVRAVKSNAVLRAMFTGDADGGAA